MKETRLLWDMPITIEIVDESVDKKAFQSVFDYFKHVDTLFNTFNASSEISRINRGEIQEEKWSQEVKEVIKLCEQTKQNTRGYFNHRKGTYIDPLGIVKGWAMQQAADSLIKKGYKNFYIDAGGDIQTQGRTDSGDLWSVGIRNPFNCAENVKILSLTDCGIATSGTYIRGNHIYNPLDDSTIFDIVSLTVIGPNVYEADRYATAAFAMGKRGIYFIEQLSEFEAYVVDSKKNATYTSGFEQYVKKTSHASSRINQTI
ncbi:MAG: FAD:protein FMN transferase [Candidatus Roizmanbacteria bacterium]|nr:FAD:protein FMN transferase [Candidatus Roizmanbacteria bacterium]